MKKTIKRKIKIVVLSLSAAIVCLITIWGACRIIAMMPHISYEINEKDTLAVFPLTIQDGNCWISIRPDDSGRIFSFIVDTGNNTDCFRIRPTDMDYLEKLGKLSKNDRWLAPYPTNSAVRKYSLGMEHDKIYKVGELPVFPYNTIRGAHFFKAGDYEYALIGMPFLENQLIEFSKRNGVMRIYKTIPNDYKRCIKLKKDTQKLFHIFRRYAIPLEINGRLNYFFIDTGAAMSPVRMPMSELKYANGNFTPDKKILSSGGDTIEVEYVTDLIGKIKFDEREYCRSIDYMEETGHETKYVINPVLFFDEDFLLDYKEMKIWFKN